MGYTASKVVGIANGEVGYIEKASNANLDSKTANAGSKNYTKYARDLAKAGYYQASKQGYAWCDMFNDWCHLQAAGGDAKVAQQVICQTGPYGAGCTESMQYYKNQNRFDKTPRVGDQIFFLYSGTGADHTGIVVELTSTQVITVEGNSGDRVQRKTYSRADKTIVGYGHPMYDAEPVKKAEQPKPQTHAETATKVKTIDEVAREVVAGKWGVGAARMNALTAAGYDYNAVQARVNVLLSGKAAKSVNEIAKEVIAGKWGNGSERKRRLTQAGYDYNAVQKRVNQLAK